MKLIREILYEKFTQDSDPIDDLGIGMMHQIKHWVKTETTYTPIDKNLLWICAKYGKVNFVKYLLNKGYDVHAEDDVALRYASSNGHTEVVKLLLDAGADVHAYNDYALRWTSANGHTEVVKLLLDAGADVHADDDEALRNTSYNGHTEVVKLLLDAGADVHAYDDEALRWASANGRTKVVKLLIDAGADVHASNDYALLYASENGHAEIVKLLKDHIAKEKKSNKRVKESLNEKFTQNSDPIEDMGIGVQGLWDYTPEEAATEIWEIMKPRIQKQINLSRRRGHIYKIDPKVITEYGCMSLSFEPNNETFKYLTLLVQKEIDKSINDNTLNIHNNIKYARINEANVNPYDKIAMMMVKKLKTKCPFKKKKSKKNQNAMVQRQFEHSIITFNEFQNLQNKDI